MNRKSRGRDQNFSIGGSAIGNAFGDNSTVGPVRVTSTGEASSASLDDLREAIGLLRAEVEAADGSEPADTELRYELRKVEEELDEDEPDSGTVRTRWKQVQKLFGPLQHAASVAQITDRILTLFAAN